MQKPIKLTTENQPAVEAALRAVNGRASTHAYTLLFEIERVAHYAEKELADLGIPKSERAGAVYSAESGGQLAKAYKYKAQSTWVELTRRGAGWYLTDASATTIYPGPRGRASWMRLTEKQDAKAIEVLRRGYSIIRSNTAPIAQPLAQVA